MVSRVVQVNAGTHKWFLVADATSNNPVPRVENTHFNVIYLPTAYGNIENVPQ
jgi:hypothetical protein